MTFLRLIPSWVWVALILVGLGAWYGSTRYDAGKRAVQKKWDAAIWRGKEELESLRVKSRQVDFRVETKYVDRVQVIREKADAIVREVPVYVAADSCPLPGGFRLLHDAAAEGTVPDPASIADAAPVEAQDAARTVAGNYGSCLETAQRLTSLQEWVTAQHALNPER